MINRYRMRFLIAVLFGGLLVGACQSTEPAKEQNKPTTPNQSSENRPSTNSSPTASLPEAGKLERIRVGHKIPEINANDFTGQQTKIASRGDLNGELLVIYSPSCEACHATMPRWIELYRQFFQPRNIPFIALSVDNPLNTANSIRELKIPFKVVVMPDVDLRLGYRVQDVPITVAVGPDGIIKKIWSGTLGNDQLADIIKAFCPECNVNVNSTKG